MIRTGGAERSFAHEAGEALAQATGQGRALVALREGLAWLQQVFEAADQAQRQ